MSWNVEPDDDAFWRLSLPASAEPVDSLWDRPSPFWPTFANMIALLESALSEHGDALPYAVLGEEEDYARVRIHFLAPFRHEEARVEHVRRLVEYRIPAHVRVRFTYAPRCLSHEDCRQLRTLGEACWRASVSDDAPRR